MPDANRYHVFGYDKDADAYETVCACPTVIRACEVASILIRHMCDKKAGGDIRRFDTGEPFDWLVVSRSDDPYDQHKMFTSEYPDGFQPPF